MCFAGRGSRASPESRAPRPRMITCDEHAERIRADQIAIGRAGIHALAMWTEASARTAPTNATQPSTRLRAAPTNGSRDHDEDAEDAEHDFRREPVQICELVGEQMDSRPHLPFGECRENRHAARQCHNMPRDAARDAERPRGREAFCGRRSARIMLLRGSFHAPREERRSDAHQEDRDGHGDENHAFSRCEASGSVRILSRR